MRFAGCGDGAFIEQAFVGPVDSCIDRLIRDLSKTEKNFQMI